MPPVAERLDFSEQALGKILSLGDGRHISYDEASVVLPRSDEALVARYVEAVLRRETAAALDAVAEAGTSGVDMDHLAAEITETLRRILLTKLAGADAFDFGLDDGGRAQLTDWAALADTPRLVTAVETMMTKRRDIKGSHIPQLPLELAAVRIAEDFATTTSAVAGFTPPAPVPIRQPKLAAKKEPVIINSAVAAGLAPLTPAAADSSVVENRHLEKKYDVPPTVIGGPETTKAEPIKLSQSISADEKATVAVQPLATRHSPPATSPVTTLENIRTIWPQYMKKVGEESQGLVYLMSCAEPINVDGETIRFGFGYAFHSEKMNNQKNKLVLERAMHAMLGRPCHLEAVHLDKKPDLGQTNSVPTAMPEAAPAVGAPNTAPSAVTGDAFAAQFGGKRIA